MYTTLKHIVKRLFPKSVLIKNEDLFRKLIARKYAGNAAQCNICKFKLKHFVLRPNGDLLCPHCGSLSRTRRLYQTLNSLDIKGKMLHFSPPRCLATKLRVINSLDYNTTDFIGEFASDFHYDITAIAAEDNTYDSIICYHVLEHIEEDTKAMSELYRVLKPQGFCLIQTPFKEGDIYEDYSIQSELGRKKAFGQEDHVRIYTVNILNERLQDAYFNTKIIEAGDDPYFGFRAETFIKATKPLA